MTSQRCRYCGSDRLRQVPWQDVLPGIPNIDTILIYDGSEPISKTLTFCESCGEWLPSTSERRQTEELIAALRLLAAVPELASARLEHADRPDLRVHLGGRVFGLEVTRIARDGPEEISRAQWRRAVERTARLIRRAQGGPAAWVSLRWNADPPRAAGQVVAGLLVDLVERHLAALPPTTHSVADLGPAEVPDELALYVHGLQILRTQADDLWVSGFANMPDVRPDELQQAIDGKADKAPDYAPAPDGLWLLIYGEATNSAQAVDVTDEARAATYSGPFDRVFFLDCMDNAIELQLR